MTRDTQEWKRNPALIRRIRENRVLHERRFTRNERRVQGSSSSTPRRMPAMARSADSASEGWVALRVFN